MAMRQVITSLSPAGAHRRAQQRQMAALNDDLHGVIYWANRAAELGYQLSQSLPSHIDPDEAWQCLEEWSESPSETRAEGYQRGLDYLADCKLHNTSPHLDVLLSRIRGRLYHNANAEDAQ